jgi:uncharacterized protein YndB with AHSA1/START domain
MKITDKKICKTTFINIPLDKVWWKWTTHEGLLTFFGRDNRIELTPGGAFEIYFLMDNPNGLRGSEGCRVLSFLPNEMFSFTWNAPPNFKEVRESDYHTWVVVQFRSISAHQTEVNLVHTGWPDDAAWHAVYDYFNKAWDEVLQSLKNSC